MKNRFFKFIILSACILCIGGTEEVAMAGENLSDDRSEKEVIYPELSPYYICLLKRGPNWTAESTPEHELLQSRHMAFIQGLIEKGKIIVAGPFEDNRDERGMAIFRTGSLDEAKNIFAEDPKVQAGHLILEWYTWLVPKGLLPE